MGPRARRLKPPRPLSMPDYDNGYATPNSDFTPATTDDDFIRGSGFDSSTSDSSEVLASTPVTMSRPSPRRTSTPSRPAPSPLRTRARQGSVKPSPGTKKLRVRPRKDAAPTKENTLLSDILSSSSGFALQILSNALWLVRKPLAWLFALYLLAVALSAAYQYAAQSVFAALAPVCKLPGVSMLDLPFCYYAPPGAVKDGQKAEVRFPELIDVQGHFSGVLQESVGGSTLALDLKNSEVAVRDLNALVRVSDLLCKDELSVRLEDFVSSAKATSRGLAKFGSRVGGVVDSLLAMDEYAIRALEAAAIAHPPPSSSLTSILLYPFRTHQDLARAEANILATFIQASTIMDTSIRRLVLDATAVLADLDELENRLMVVEEIVRREDSLITTEQQEVLAAIWTLLGGNRQKLANFANNKSLLAAISGYRARALAHVSASLIQLQQMQADLEDLRDRVAAPALMEDAGKTGTVPLEVQVVSIRKGIERLNEGMSNAKKKEGEHLRKLMREAEKEEKVKLLEMQAGAEKNRA